MGIHDRQRPYLEYRRPCQCSGSCWAGSHSSLNRSATSPFTSVSFVVLLGLSIVLLSFKPQLVALVFRSDGFTGLGHPGFLHAASR